MSENVCAICNEENGHSSLCPAFRRAALAKIAALEKRLEAAEAVVEYLKYLDGPENYSFPGIHCGPELDQLIERLAAYDQLKEAK